MTTIVYSKASFDNGFPSPPINLLIALLREEGVEIKIEPGTDPQEMAKVLHGISNMLQQATGCTDELFEFFEGLKQGASYPELADKAMTVIEAMPECEDGCSCHPPGNLNQ